ncbi:Pyrrolidone-carboxylate peptidase 1 [Rhodovastum atsumiense]|uniref:Pyrrolidone-carboxylate peptidase n=1 Tax=Rhodovastum atsumiense TaxID=504468 RepID=A0A5M6IJ86_9PROT|nr:pyroglutamyl-peptidase I [Rhodovastum atsumiense]KAA5608310.1 pyroglutamyl-peptidase I [Rhodovastum atsumiense]CAH2605063.1 Pyrrolidone-carboxylate peptidase 1 [Rhodovastum atsumiense]
MSTRTVLVTGFEPFGGEAVNPSMAAVQGLAAAPPPGVALHTLILPVSLARTGPALRAAIAGLRPDVVIATGQAGGRAEISVERVAINVNDFRVPDNDGAQPTDAPVVATGPAAYFATIPVKSVVARLHASGIPAQLSNSAGTHLCNHTLYLLGHLAATEQPGLRGGFLHLPWLPEQVVRHPGQPSMGLPTLVLALKTAITAACETADDLRVAMGATH